MLEAGAGSISYFVLAEGAELIALDISHGQLMRNPLTSLRVQGDLQRLPIAPGSVDMVVCFNVIEHVPDAALALEGMRNCLAPCGVLLLGFPHRSSLKALVTRVTPLAVHRAWYRHVVGKKDRGEGYFDAFPMVFHPAMAVPRVLAWLAQRGFEVKFFRAYDGVAEYGIAGHGLKGRIARGVYDAISLVGRAATFGRWRPTESDVILIASVV